MVRGGILYSLHFLGKNIHLSYHLLIVWNVLAFCKLGGDKKFSRVVAGLRWNPRVYGLITQPGSGVLSPCSSLPSSWGWGWGWCWWCCQWREPCWWWGHFSTKIPFCWFTFDRAFSSCKILSTFSRHSFLEAPLHLCVFFPAHTYMQGFVFWEQAGGRHRGQAGGQRATIHSRVGTKQPTKPPNTPSCSTIQPTNHPSKQALQPIPTPSTPSRPEWWWLWHSHHHCLGLCVLSVSLSPPPMLTKGDALKVHGVGIVWYFVLSPIVCIFSPFADFPHCPRWNFIFRGKFR